MANVVRMVFMVVVSLCNAAFDEPSEKIFRFELSIFRKIPRLPDDVGIDCVVVFDLLGLIR